jgi:hypothetical protein
MDHGVRLVLACAPRVVSGVPLVHAEASRVVSLKAFGLAEAPGGLIEYLQFWLEHPGCPLKCFQHREGGKTVSQVQKGI